MIFFGEASLRKAVNGYATHYHSERAYQGLGNELVESTNPVGPSKWSALNAMAACSTSTDVRLEEAIGGGPVGDVRPVHSTRSVLRCFTASNRTAKRP